MKSYLYGSCAYKECNSNLTQGLMFVQVLRAVAALSAVFFHILKNHSNHFVDSMFTGLPLYRGVDLFFVISGFVMVYTSWDRFGSIVQARAFFVRRLQRIVPLYWFYSSLMVVIMLIVPQALNSTKFDLKHIFSSYFFIPYERVSDNWTVPILTGGWTLNFEMFFYLIFAFFVLFQRKIALVLLIITMILIVFLGYAFKPESVVLKMWTHSIILEFVFGCLIAVAYKYTPDKKKNPFLSLFLLILSLVFFLNKSFLGDELPRFIVDGIPSAFLVAVAALATPLRWERYFPRFLLSIGDSSYSLYLIHPFVIRLSNIAIEKMQIGRSLDGILFDLYFILLILGIVFSGYLSRTFIELPLNDLIQKIKFIFFRKSS